MSQYHILEVLSKKKETREATTLRLGIPEGSRAAFDSKPGQFLTLHFELGGSKFNRCYSIVETAKDNSSITITVKRVNGGRITRYLLDILVAGDTVHASTPDGQFFLDISSEIHKSYFFIAAGSGITPIYSMITALISSDSKAPIYLLYANKKQETNEMSTEKY